MSVASLLDVEATFGRCTVTNRSSERCLIYNLM